MKRITRVIKKRKNEDGHVFRVLVNITDRSAETEMSSVSSGGNDMPVTGRLAKTANQERESNKKLLMAFAAALHQLQIVEAVNGKRGTGGGNGYKLVSIGENNQDSLQFFLLTQLPCM